MKYFLIVSSIYLGIFKLAAYQTTITPKTGVKSETYSARAQSAKTSTGGSYYGSGGVHSGK